MAACQAAVLAIPPGILLSGDAQGRGKARLFHCDGSQDGCFCGGKCG